jgi:hypothetical protein
MIQPLDAAESSSNCIVFFIADDVNTGWTLSTITKIDNDYHDGYKSPAAGRCYKALALWYVPRRMCLSMTIMINATPARSVPGGNHIFFISICHNAGLTVTPG